MYIELGSTLFSSYIGKDLVELDGKGEPKWDNGQGIGHKVQSACQLASHWKKGGSPLHTNLTSKVLLHYSLCHVYFV